MGTPKKAPTLQNFIDRESDLDPPKGLDGGSGPAEPAKTYEQDLADYRRYRSNKPALTENGYIQSLKRTAVLPKRYYGDVGEHERVPRFRLPEGQGYLTDTIRDGDEPEYSTTSPHQSAHNAELLRGIKVLSSPKEERESELASLVKSKGLRKAPTTPEEYLEAGARPNYTGFFSRFKRRLTPEQVYWGPNHKVEDASPQIMQAAKPASKPVNYGAEQRAGLKELEAYKARRFDKNLRYQETKLLERGLKEGPGIRAADPQLRALHEHNIKSDHLYNRRVRDGLLGEDPYSIIYPAETYVPSGQKHFFPVDPYTPQGLHRLQQTRKPIYAHPPVITGDTETFKPSGDPVQDQLAHPYVENIKRLGIRPNSYAADKLKSFERGLPAHENLTRVWNRSLGLPDENTQTAKIPVPKELAHLPSYKAKKILDAEDALRERARGLPLLQKYFKDKGFAEGDKIISSSASELRGDVAKHKGRHFRDLGGILTGIGDEKNPLQRAHAAVTGSSNRSDAFNTAVGVGAAGVGAVGGGALLLHKMRKAREAAKTSPSLVRKLKLIRR